MIAGMFQYEPSADDLLLAWQDANRAADLAERPTRVAFDTSEQRTSSAVESEALAALAEHAARAAYEAATTARRGARRAHDAATRGRDAEIATAETAVRARDDERLAGRSP